MEKKKNKVKDFFAGLFATIILLALITGALYIVKLAFFADVSLFTAGVTIVGWLTVIIGVMVLFFMIFFAFLRNFFKGISDKTSKDKIDYVSTIRLLDKRIQELKAEKEVKKNAIPS